MNDDFTIEDRIQRQILQSECRISSQIQLAELRITSKLELNRTETVNMIKTTIIVTMIIGLVVLDWFLAWMGS